MPSRRVYITLNTDKEKDRIIESYLAQSYSEADAIKEAIYRLATSSTEKVQLIPKGDKKVRKDTKGNKKGVKGANGNNEVEKVTNDNEEILNVTNTTQLSPLVTNDNHKSQIKPNRAEELRQKKLKTLSQFL